MNSALAETLATFGGGGAVAIAGLKLFERIMSLRQSGEQRASASAAALIELALKASGSSVEQLLTRLDEAEEQIKGANAKIAELTESHAACETRCEELQVEVKRLSREATERLLSDPTAREPGGALTDSLMELRQDGATITPLRKGD